MRSPITFWNSTTAITYQFLDFAGAKGCCKQIADNLLSGNSQRSQPFLLA
jgi:hypothetical protein